MQMSHISQGAKQTFSPMTFHQDVKALVRLRLGPSVDQMVQPLLCQVIPSFLVANASMIFIINVHQSLQYQCLKWS